MPLFAWADLDPKGSQIVMNIADRVGRPVKPVLMDAPLLAETVTVEASADNVSLAGALAMENGTGDLAQLAAAIAAERVTVEQEALHLGAGG